MLQEKTSRIVKPTEHSCRLLFAICCLNISSGLGGAEVYKWVDANGVVTYSQQKPNNISSSSVTTTSTPPSALIAQEKARIAQETLEPELTENQQQKLVDLQTIEDNRVAEEAARKASICKSSTNRLAKLTEKERVRVYNQDGTLRILPEEERQERITSAKEKIDQNCK